MSFVSRKNRKTFDIAILFKVQLMLKKQENLKYILCFTDAEIDLIDHFSTTENCTNLHSN